MAPHCPDPSQRHVHPRRKRTALAEAQKARKRPERARRAFWPWFALGAALPVAWLALEAVCARPPVQVAERQAGLGEVPSVVDVEPNGTLTMQAGRALPLKPEKGWRKAPCGEHQVEAIGACFVWPAKPDGTLPRPPCPVNLYEHKGRCLQPVAAGKRPDTSMEE